jgi:hypothetical protein
VARARPWARAGEREFSADGGDCGRQALQRLPMLGKIVVDFSKGWKKQKSRRVPAPAFLG